MNSRKVAETIQQNREWARAEYETKTKGLIFTKDFQTRQDALMHDPLATVGERVMAWILRRSWGEYVLYAIKDDGEPAYQRDCAKDLGIDKRLVSNAVAYYQKRGYLDSHPKKLYPVISPALSKSPLQKVTRSPDFLQFIEEWKVTHSTDFQELEVARSTVERIRKVILSEYKKSKHPVENGGLSLLETGETFSETQLPTDRPSPREESEVGRSVQVLPITTPEAKAPEAEAEPPAKPPSESEELKPKIREWLVKTYALPTAPSTEVLAELARSCTDEAGFDQFKTECAKTQNADPKSYRYFLPIARRCAEHRPEYEEALRLKKAMPITNGFDEERVRRLAAQVEEDRKWR